jgi:uncharacterized protein (TIGR00369 family)
MSDVQETVSTERSHTFTWQDPTIGANVARTMSGLEYLRAMMNGEFPFAPIGSLMNMHGAEVEEGRVVFVAEPAEYHYNPIGTVHGGFAATLLDSALGCSVHSMLPAGTAYTTLEIKVNYLRPITAKTGTMYCEGKVVHMGGRVATAEARLTDASGKLYAHGTTTCIILRPDRTS